MDRYNYFEIWSCCDRSHFVKFGTWKSTVPELQTEEDQIITGYAVADTAQLSAEIAPNLLEIGEISTPSETPWYIGIPAILE